MYSTSRRLALASEHARTYSGFPRIGTFVMFLISKLLLTMPNFVVRWIYLFSRQLLQYLQKNLSPLTLLFFNADFAYN
ncbi:hypothetical protein NC651_012656 [Populus alba x Populus x berolinensis]|nr:hypothetical protein NC651_012656 [Populus alba x Populus x berolinensis]